MIIDAKSKFVSRIVVNEIIEEISEALKEDGSDRLLYASTVPNIDLPLGVAFGLTDKGTGFFVSLRNHKLNNVDEQQARLQAYYERMVTNELRKTA